MSTITNFYILSNLFQERHRVKQMLAQQEVLFPRLYWSLKTALLPVMSINLTGLENSIFGKSSNLQSILMLENKEGINGIKIENNDDEDEL